MHASLARPIGGCHLMDVVKERHTSDTKNIIFRKSKIIFYKMKDSNVSLSFLVFMQNIRALMCCFFVNNNTANKVFIYLFPNYILQ